MATRYVYAIERYGQYVSITMFVTSLPLDLLNKKEGSSKTHLCAVILLRRPPGPVVFVTTAHCTLLCKTENGEILPNCCCENVSSRRCSENVVCKNSPSVTTMSSDDVEVICGDWETGNAPKESSGEKYNVVFQIQVRFPC